MSLKSFIASIRSALSPKVSSGPDAVRARTAVAVGAYVAYAGSAPDALGWGTIEKSTRERLAPLGIDKSTIRPELLRLSILWKKDQAGCEARVREVLAVNAQGDEFIKALIAIIDDVRQDQDFQREAVGAAADELLSILSKISEPDDDD